LGLIEADIAAARSLSVVDLRGDLVDPILLRLARDFEPDALVRRFLMSARREPSTWRRLIPGWKQVTLPRVSHPGGAAGIETAPELAGVPI